MMKKANMTVPMRMPKTLSIRYPPTKGNITLGHEYQEYKLANSYVVTPIVLLISSYKTNPKMRVPIIPGQEIGY